MELIDLSKYFEISDPKLLSFDEMKKIKKVWLTHELELVDELDNVQYARSLAQRGITVAPISRKPPVSKYVDRNTFPRRVILEMTSRCNFLCKMCPQHDLERPRIDMPGELFRKTVDELDKHGIEGLWIYHLGEAILHPEFKKNIEYISTKKNLGAIWMSTNGQRFNEDIATSVLKSKIDFINFSAHAITEETYKKVAPKGGNFKTVQSNLNRLYALKGVGGKPKRPYVHTQMIEQDVTKHEIDGFILKHYKKADIVSVNMLEYANLPNNQYGHETTRVRRELTSCPRISRNSAFILSNGAVTPCDATYNGEICYGNITKNSLEEIWADTERLRVAGLNSSGRMHEIDHCAKCPDHDIILMGIEAVK